MGEKCWFAQGNSQSSEEGSEEKCWFAQGHHDTPEEDQEEKCWFAQGSSKSSKSKEKCWFAQGTSWGKDEKCWFAQGWDAKKSNNADDPIYGWKTAAEEGGPAFGGSKRLLLSPEES